MRERYSSGLYGEIFPVSSEQKLLFPQADLVREEELMDRFWFARLFYVHKIASLLFPGRFIEVVGAQNKVAHEGAPADEFSPADLARYKLILLSKEANVNPDHAVFSNHYTQDAKFGRVWKLQMCKCERCIRHRRFHRHNDLKSKARAWERRMRRVGIFVSPRDKTDYCLDDNGIVFFELDNLDRRILRKFLNGRIKFTQNEQTAIQLLDRYDKSIEDSKRIAFSIGGEMRG